MNKHSLGQIEILPICQVSKHVTNLQTYRIDTHKTKGCQRVVKTVVTKTTLWLSSKKLSKLSAMTTLEAMVVTYGCQSCLKSCHYDNLFLVVFRTTH